MENTNTNFVKLLSQLLEKVKALIDKIDRREQVYAKILQQKPTAQLTEEELEKIKHTISTTSCKAPDTEELSKQIAKGVVMDVKNDVKDAVEETIKSMRIKVDHHHVHTKLWELTQMVEEKTRHWFYILGVLCVTLGLSLAIFLFNYYRSDEYWGKQYMDVIGSDYVTKQEKKLFWERRRPTGFLPLEFDTDPDYVKAKIKQNKLVIKERRQQANDNDGKWAPTVPIER